MQLIKSRALSTGSISLQSARRYTEDHEWISVSNGVGTVGITDYAQKALGDVVYVEVPEVGTQLAAQDTLGAVESVKAASDIYSPVAGTVVESNKELVNEPTLVNLDPYKAGWLCKIKLSSENDVDSLLDENAYTKFCESQ